MSYEICPVGKIYNRTHATCRTCTIKCTGKGAAQPHRAKKSKYGNRKVVVDDVLFDSKREASRYQKLKLMGLAGEISGLRLQVRFELAPAVVINGRKKPALRYYADFVYLDKSGGVVVEDAKGHRDGIYKIKRHLMKSVHGIDILET